jgi:hypothetical protein
MNEWINEQLFVTYVSLLTHCQCSPGLLFGLSVNLLGHGEARTQSIHSCIIVVIINHQKQAKQKGLNLCCQIVAQIFWRKSLIN